jgi:hypothetical protein
VEGNDPHGGNGYVCEGDTALCQVEEGEPRMVETKLLCLYSDLPPPHHPPSDWLKLFSSQTFYSINTATVTPVILQNYPPMKMEQTLLQNFGI